MRKRARTTPRVLALAIAAIVGTSMFALTAANTVPGTTAGSGAATISGYTITNVAYNLNATSPANIDSVTFTLDTAATTVMAKVVSSTTSYYSCTNTSGTNWSCATTSPQATVSAANELSVLATA